ncbi:competence protein ComGF [Synergistales bacterium]|nr:competence protein ComGF [Synergistales bacterium]
MITRTLLERIFSAASMERWNDHPHPAVFTELGKQAHKMIISWVLGRLEEDKGRAVDWIKLIEGGIFEFLHRVVVTDIRPPVFHRLMEDMETRNELNDWVYRNLASDLTKFSAQFANKFREYHKTDKPSLEREILRASHFMATKWEFDFIYHWSAGMYGVEDVKRDIESQIEKLSLGKGIIATQNSPLWKFISLVGQLTFQKRWAQTPRLPQTSVLGHMLFVGLSAYMISIEIGACPRRARNDFFGGLFHDLPEVLTRDIVSPVKASVEGLDALIRRYEQEEMNHRIFPLLPAQWSEELRYYTEEEFKNKTLHEDRIDSIQRHDGDIPSELNRCVYNPIDGRVIEVCDKLAAYIEASVSIRMGVRPQALEEGKRNIYDRFAGLSLYGYPVGQLFDLFW